MNRISIKRLQLQNRPLPMQSFSFVKAKKVPRTLLQCEDSDEEAQPSTGPGEVVRASSLFVDMCVFTGSPDWYPEPKTGPCPTTDVATLPRLQRPSPDHLASGNEAADRGEYSLALRHWEEGLRQGSTVPHILHEQMSQVRSSTGGLMLAFMSSLAEWHSPEHQGPPPIEHLFGSRPFIGGGCQVSSSLYTPCPRCF